MINTSNPSVSQEFDAVAFELEHSKDFQVLQNTYTNYEIDSVEYLITLINSISQNNNAKTIDSRITKKSPNNSEVYR